MTRRDRGRQIMRQTLGNEYCDARDQTTNEFNAPLRQLSEEAAYGYVWAREGLDARTRSLLCLGILTALNRPHELRIHLQGALNNGCTVEEIRETLLQSAIYCGVPAAVDSFRIAEEVLREAGKLPR
ncbi:MAG: carboxymuconolactone decarboxylase family protein [Alphaproteobacteria bacterium]|nr:carboxymuconolactone decarboxylase family protein [Alphaproteobacteria bacterium]